MKDNVMTGGVVGIETVVALKNEDNRNSVIEMRATILQSAKDSPCQMPGIMKFAAGKRLNTVLGARVTDTNIAGNGILTHTITDERLAKAGYFSILNHYESLYSCD